MFYELETKCHLVKNILPSSCLTSDKEFALIDKRRNT